jgi:phosphoserine phosphatase
MGHDPTVQPTVSRADLQDEPQEFDGDVEGSPQLAVHNVADTVSNVQLKTAGHVRSAVAEDAKESTLSSIAAVLLGDCPTFINTLSRTVEAEITPNILRKLQRTAQSASDDAATFERLAIVAIDGTKPSVATEICAALAARTAGLSVQRANGALDAADAAELFTAWLETARAMIAARGFAGLRRLLPTARLLARRSAERGDSAIEIAATMHRIAARIVADLSLERVLDLAAAEQESDLAVHRTVDPRCALSQSPAQMILHPR